MRLPGGANWVRSGGIAATDWVRSRKNAAHSPSPRPAEAYLRRHNRSNPTRLGSFGRDRRRELGSFAQLSRRRELGSFAPFPPLVIGRLRLNWVRSRSFHVDANGFVRAISSSCFGRLRVKGFQALLRRSAEDRRAPRPSIGAGRRGNVRFLESPASPRGHPDRVRSPTEFRNRGANCG